MIELVDYSDWEEYDGFAEGSGCSEKVWLESTEGKIGLFKFPKVHTENDCVTTEHVSEHLAYVLGKMLDVETAEVDIGTYNGRIGSMSYFVCKPGEYLIEGISFISGKYPQYDTNKMMNTEDNQYYCLEQILRSVPKDFPVEYWIEMMLFDFLIGNRDRHQSNWALLFEIINTSKDPEYMKMQLKSCPLYDNGSSLCCYITEDQLPELLGKDIKRFNAVVDSKSKSIIRIDGSNKNTPKHSDVVKYLLSNFHPTEKIARRFLKRLNANKIREVLNEYPESILSQQKKELISRFLIRKLEILEILLNEVSKDE